MQIHKWGVWSGFYCTHTPQRWPDRVRAYSCSLSSCCHAHTATVTLIIIQKFTARGFTLHIRISSSNADFHSDGTGFQSLCNGVPTILAHMVNVLLIFSPRQQYRDYVVDSGNVTNVKIVCETCATSHPHLVSFLFLYHPFMPKISVFHSPTVRIHLGKWGMLGTVVG